MGIVENSVEPGALNNPVPESHETFGRRARPILGGLAAIAMLCLIAQVVLIEPSQQRLRSRADSASTTIDPNSDAFASGAVLGRPESFVPTGTDEILAVVEAVSGESNQAQMITLLHVGSGNRIRLAAPEPLVDTQPVSLDNHLVVVGQQGAWIGNVTSGDVDWNFLGAADTVRPSSQPNRVWLRTDAIPDDTSTNGEPKYEWSEVTFSGEVTRSLFRNEELNLPTPELTAGKGTGIFRLATEAEMQELGIASSSEHWRPLSVRGVVVAVGPNDVVTSECLSFLACDRVWYDAISGQIRGGLHDDLADHIDPRFVALLSPFGRFSASEIDATMTKITSVATQAEIGNVCHWGGSMSWTTSSELLACDTADGLEVYDLVAGRSLGLVSGPNSAWRRAVFIISDGPLG